MAKQRKKLCEYLLHWGNINKQQVQEALKVAQGSGKRIGETLIELGYAKEDDVSKALASQFDLEFIDLSNPDTMRNAKIDLLPQDLIKKYLVLPLSKENGRLRILIHDPMDLELLDLLRFRMTSEIDTCLASRSRIKEYIDRFISESGSASIDEAVRQLTIDQSGADLGTDAEGGAVTHGQLIKEADSAPIIRLVTKLINEAVNQRASDIHVEPMKNRVRIRYRIDGVCHVRDDIPKRMQGSIMTRLKIMAGMKIDERRVPQDGRIKLKIGNDNIDFRVSACPAYHGESVVMRILRPDSVRVGLLNIGFEPDTLESFNRVIRRPNGIFLVTGPTGSGKTTTLYTALDVLNRPDKKIITAEDPVEYNFTGINQCQIRHDIGLDFNIILRTMLRQAPNIILVGEIRDKEVAEIAIQAALTGHLVFSTLHTNDAPSAITRLIDMGVKPFLVASSIQAVMGQRLIRILCPKCKAPDESPNRFQLKLCGIKKEDLENHVVYKPVGCAACANTGYRGRKAIFEFMIMNTELRELAFNRSPATQLRAAAAASGMRNLVGDGRLKILAGVTTAEEVARSAQIEGIVEMEEESESTAT